MNIRIYWKYGGFVDQEISSLASIERIGIGDMHNVARIDQLGEDKQPLPGFLPPECEHPADQIYTERRLGGRHYCNRCGADLIRWTGYEEGSKPE
jgi:hypothetical protein